MRLLGLLVSWPVQVVVGALLAAAAVVLVVISQGEPVIWGTAVFVGVIGAAVLVSGLVRRARGPGEA